MALTAVDLIQPKGPVDMALFPGLQSNVVSAIVDQYLTTAYNDERVAAQTDVNRKDMLAQAWALYLVFGTVYTRMLAEPLTVNLTDKGSHGYSTEQIRGMAGLRDKYLADFNGLILVPGALPPSQFPGSFSLRNRVEF
jgi:hypothetical protein